VLLCVALVALILWYWVTVERERAEELQQEALVQKQQADRLQQDADAIRVLAEQAKQEADAARRAEQLARKQMEEEARHNARKVHQPREEPRQPPPAPEPQRNVKEGPVPPPETPKNTTASEVISAYQGNDAYGDEKYLGKLLRVTGKPGRVRRLVQGDEGTPCYLLTVLGAPQEPGQMASEEGFLVFKFSAESRKQLAALPQLTEGAELVIEGRCEGRLSDTGDAIAFSNARIVKVIHPRD
jgi:ATPase subunit of ABC transporter with duplicated ATPase domains